MVLRLNAKIAFLVVVGCFLLRWNINVVSCFMGENHVQTISCSNFACPPHELAVGVRIRQMCQVQGETEINE